MRINFMFNRSIQLAPVPAHINVATHTLLLYQHTLKVTTHTWLLFWQCGSTGRRRNAKQGQRVLRHCMCPTRHVASCTNAALQLLVTV